MPGKFNGGCLEDPPVCCRVGLSWVNYGLPMPMQWIVMHPITLWSPSPLDIRLRMPGRCITLHQTMVAKSSSSSFIQVSNEPILSEPVSNVFIMLDGDGHWRALHNDCSPSFICDATDEWQVFLDSVTIILILIIHSKCDFIGGVLVDGDVLKARARALCGTWVGERLG